MGVEEDLSRRMSSIVSKHNGTYVLVAGESTVTVDVAHIRSVLLSLRDEPQTSFEQLIDLCAVDYLKYGQEGALPWTGSRYAVVYHLLSVTRNHRLRIVTWLDEDRPQLPSVIDIWRSADWFEREAFDLFGIIFEGHPDLRRILTDYGFIGHPFRKDFPLSGHVEMRYDEEKKRVIYEPVSIEPRVTVPRVIREGGYSDRNS